MIFERQNVIEKTAIWLITPPMISKSNNFFSLFLSGLEDCVSGKIVEANCVKSKVYHYMKEVEEEDAEGQKSKTFLNVVKQKSISKKSTRKNFLDVLFKPKTTIRAQYQEIARKDCLLYTRQVNKQALNALNDKQVSVFKI